MEDPPETETINVSVLRQLSGEAVSVSALRSLLASGVFAGLIIRGPINLRCCSVHNCPLYEACGENDYQEVKTVLETKTACNLNFLLEKVGKYGGDPRIAQLLIEHGGTAHHSWFDCIQGQYKKNVNSSHVETDAKFLVSLLDKSTLIPAGIPPALVKTTMNLGVPRVTFSGIQDFVLLSQELDEYQAQVALIFSRLLPPELAWTIAAFFP